MRLDRSLPAALLAPLLALTLTGALAPPPSIPAPGISSDPLDGLSGVQTAGVPQAGQALLELAGRVGAAGSASAALQEAGVLPAAAAPATRSPDLATALARLGPAPGGADGAGGVDALVAGLSPADAQALLPLVDAVADAAALVEQAFARLAPEQRALVRAHALDPAPSSTPEGAEAARLTGLVDLGAFAQATAGLLAAAEAFLATQPAPPAIPEVPDSVEAGELLPDVPADASAMFSGSCGFGGMSLVSFGGLVEVGLTGTNAYNDERLLLVDLGGDDCYDNYPAAVGPGSAFPVFAVVDVGGNDVYITPNEHSSPTDPGTTWSGGVGIGGVGLLVDRWGDDRYFASLNNVAPNCAALGGYPTGDSWQRVYAHGVGILGAGGLVDLSGNDRYSASSTKNAPDGVCSTGRAYTYAQGTGSRLGIGFLLDSTGNDRYGATASSQATRVSGAHAHGQGTAAGRGIGALIDEEGNDDYSTSTSAALTPGFTAGATAYTFAQASLYGTNEPRGEGVTPPDCEQLGIDCKCPVEQLCRIDCSVPAVCNLIGQPIVPVVPGGPAAPAANVCSTVLRLPAGGGTVGGPCDLPAVALLLDVQGLDVYRASSSAVGNGQACQQGVWAGTAAQGSAPAKGVALLGDAAIDTMNAFDASANADAIGCQPYGVRASDSSQGFGGAFLWDLWDAPPFDPLLVTDLSAGILARGGLCGQPLDFSQGINLQLDMNDPCSAPWAGDFYGASATAKNTAAGGLAWAQTRAHGSGNGDLGTFPNPAVPGGPYQALGVGGHLDVFGDDWFSATADATAPLGTPEPLTVAQGAAQTAVGVLVNVGDVDEYYAMSHIGGTPLLPVPQATQWSLPHVIAQADATVPAPVILVTVGVAFAGVNNAVAVLVDVFGFDTYSLAPYCPNNGAFPAFPYIWGNQDLLTDLTTALHPAGPGNECHPALGPTTYANNAPGSPGPGTAGMALGIDW